jgi:DNA-binding NarL/FixJ family response regulator
MKRPTAIVADDHHIVVNGLRAVLKGHVDIIATCADGQELLDATRRLRPNLVIADISMPRMTGLEYLRAIRTDPERPRVILLSMYGDETIVAAAFRSGARGYVPKHAAGEELVAAVQSVVRGQPYVSPLLPVVPPEVRRADADVPRASLTTRQREVLALVAAGKRMKEIAATLHLSRRTVEMHKYHMMQQLGLRTTADLIQYFVRNEARVTPDRRADDESRADN